MRCSPLDNKPKLNYLEMMGRFSVLQTSTYGGDDMLTIYMSLARPYSQCARHPLNAKYGAVESKYLVVWYNIIDSR